MSLNAQDTVYLWGRRLVLFCACVVESSGELPSRPRELLGPHGGSELRGGAVRFPVRRGGGVLAALLLGRHEFPRGRTSSGASAAVVS